jgi:hypothetical protein
MKADRCRHMQADRQKQTDAGRGMQTGYRSRQAEEE